ncbi:MAG: LPS export ABC transporter periplasmic protein LptC [Dialister sp.]|nr:LPS export ABC transporter periplasmic protein LptC [Dialister sp.]
MRKHKSLILTVLVILLVALAYYLLFSGTGTDQKQTLPPSAMEFDNLDLKEETDGQLVWKLKAAHVKMDNDKNTIRMDGVEIYFSKDGNELHVTGDSGMLKQKEKTVDITGHVEGKTADGMIYRGDNIHYDGKTQILSSDRHFSAERNGRVLTAESFKADRMLERIEAKGNARLADKEGGE